MSLGMPIKTSKSNSMGSINSDACDNSLDHAEIMSLTHTVRSFSDALNKLKATFCQEQGNYYNYMFYITCIVKRSQRWCAFVPASLISGNYVNF